MMKLLKSFLIVLLTIELTSCITLEHDVNFDPKLTFNSKNSGNNSKIMLEVNDKRHNQDLIGRRGNGIVYIAKISTEQNLEKLIFEKFSEILQSNKFEINDYSNKRLVINLLNLDYKNFLGLISVGTSVDTVIEVLLYINDKEVVKNIYRSNLETSTYFISPFASTNRKNINISFEKALNSILSDEKLIDELK